RASRRRTAPWLADRLARQPEAQALVDRGDRAAHQLGFGLVRIEHEATRGWRIEARHDRVDEPGRAVRAAAATGRDVARDALARGLRRAVEEQRERIHAVGLERRVEPFEVAPARERDAVDHAAAPEHAVDLDREQHRAERRALLGVAVAALRE